MTENELHTDQLFNFFPTTERKKKPKARLTRHFWIFLSGYLFINLISSQFQNYQIEKNHHKVVQYLELVGLKESANRAISFYDNQMQLDNEKLKNLATLKYQDDTVKSQIDNLTDDFKMNEQNLVKAQVEFSDIQNQLDNFQTE